MKIKNIVLLTLAAVFLLNTGVLFSQDESDDDSLELIVIGPPRSVLKMWGGGEVVIDPTGKYVFKGLKPGDTIIFTAEVPGHYSEDYAIEIGDLSKTYRLAPPPTGVIAGELKFTDEDFAPGLGVEFYLNPEDFYLSFDFYQSFFAFKRLFDSDLPELSTKYVMPMMGAGFYLFPYDSFFRINLASSVGGIFGNGLPHPVFAAELSAAAEIKFLQHYIIFVEMNPRLMMPVSGGWEAFNDIFGASRADSLDALGSWAITGFPSTWFGIKYKY